MAFENVFRGIDFQAPNRAGRADQQMLMQALGQGIGAYERGQEREIQKMQLEQKAQAARDKAGAFDLKKMGEQALYELNNGFEPTPERVAMAKAYSQSKSPVFNPISGELAPSPFQQAMGNTQAAFQGKPAQVQPVSTEQLGQPIAGGAAPSDPMQASKDAIAARQAQIGSNKHQRPELQIEPPTGASPKTQQAAQEASVDIKKQYAEKSMNNLFEDEKLNRASIAKQTEYEDNVGKLLASYEKLIKSGGAIETLSDDYTVDDVFKNISARLGSSGIGRAAGGAIGTKAEAARQDISTVIPLMFGDLRKLMGMTGKELDTQKERDFYLNALSNPNTNIKTNLETIRGLSSRFGSGKTAEKVDDVVSLLGGSKPTGDLNAEEQSELDRLRQKYGSSR